MAVPDLALALGVAALGALFLLGLADIPAESGYSRVGPRFFPSVIASALVACGLWLAALAWRGSAARPAVEEDADPDGPLDWRALGLMTLALVANILLIDRLGFVLASTLLFMLTARAFRSRQTARDALIGLALSLVAYLGFTRGLDLSLPAGILRGIL